MPQAMYSETCLRRPLEGPSKRGLCYQVVSLSRVIRLETTSLGPGSSGLPGQVVVLSERSPSQVLLYDNWVPTYVRLIAERGPRGYDHVPFVAVSKRRDNVRYSSSIEQKQPSKISSVFPPELP